MGNKRQSRKIWKRKERKRLMHNNRKMAKNRKEEDEGKNRRNRRKREGKRCRRRYGEKGGVDGNRRALTHLLSSL